MEGIRQLLAPTGMELDPSYGPILVNPSWGGTWFEAREPPELVPKPRKSTEFSCSQTQKSSLPS